MLERVKASVADVVGAELERRPATPSFATHLASGLGALDLAAGEEASARVRFEQAQALDRGNLLPALELLGLDLRSGRMGPALRAWQRLGEESDPGVPADRLRRVARALAVRSIQRHPGLRETARSLAARLARIRLPQRS